MKQIKITQGEYAALQALLMDECPDTFNPKVYVNLEARFGDNQPKEGVIFEHPTQWKRSILTIDTYGRGDVHNVRTPTTFSRKRRANWNAPMPFPANLKTIADALFMAKKPIKNRIKKIILGSNSDPFMWMDHKYGITKATLNIIQSYAFKIDSVEIHTRSDLIAHDDYIEALTGIAHMTTIVIHIGRGGDQVLRCIEPGAPSKQRRFQAARRLRERGFNVKIVREGTMKGNMDLALKPKKIGALKRIRLTNDDMRDNEANTAHSKRVGA